MSSFIVSALYILFNNPLWQVYFSWFKKLRNVTYFDHDVAGIGREFATSDELRCNLKDLGEEDSLSAQILYIFLWQTPLPEIVNKVLVMF